MLIEDHRVKEVCLAYLKGEIPSLSLAVSGLCNMRCLYCDRDAGKVQDNEMSSKEKVELFNKIVPFGIKVVDFCLEGEPLLDPAIWRILEIAKKNNVLPFMFSNLTQIHSLEIAKKLLGNNVTIAGKMDRKGNFDDILNRKGASQKISKAWQFLLEAGYPRTFDKNGQKYTKLSCVFVPTHLNYKDINQVANFCKENQVLLRVGELEIIGRAGENENKLSISRDELDFVYKEISSIYGFDYLAQFQECCFNLLGLMILTDGRVVVDQYGLSCPFVFPNDMVDLETITVGNALEDDISVIWKEVEEIRVKNVGKLEERIEKILIKGPTLGCSGKSDVIIKKAAQLIKEKHKIS